MFNITDVTDKDGNVTPNPVTLNINNVTIQNAGVIAASGASVLYINNADSIVTLNSVTLADNEQRAISNILGTLILKNVTFDAAEYGNTLYNTGIMLTSGTNEFNTVVTNEVKAKNAPANTVLTALLPQNFTIADENVTFITTGVNEFNEDIVNNATIQFAGTNDSLMNIKGMGTTYFTGKATLYGDIDDDIVIKVSANGQLIISSIEAENTDGEGVITRDISPASITLDMVNGGDTWDKDGKITLDGGIFNFYGNDAADDADNDTKKNLNGYFSSTSRGGYLNLNSGVFVVKNASTSTAERNDLVDEVKVTINKDAKLLITGYEVVNFDKNDVIHEGSEIELIDSAKFVLNGITYINENNIKSNDLQLVNDNFISGDSATAKFINNGINITIASDQSVFKGIYEQNNNAVLDVLYGGAIFGGEKYINSGKVKIAGDTIDYTGVYLGNNVEFINIMYSANEVAKITTNGTTPDAIGVLNFIGEGAVAKFGNGVANAKYVKYELANNIENDKTNTIMFENAEVRLTADGTSPNKRALHNYAGTTIYKFTNSYINLTSRELSDFLDGKLKADAGNAGGNADAGAGNAGAGAGNDTCDIYQFTNLVTDKDGINKTYVAMDIDFENRVADNVYIKSMNSSGYLYIDSINIMTEPVKDDGQDPYTPLRIIQYDNSLLAGYTAEQLKSGSGLNLVELVLTHEGAYVWESNIEDTYTDKEGN